MNLLHCKLYKLLMNLKNLSNSIQYLVCNKHYEQLSMVCLQKKCQENILICPICEDNSHKGHKVTSLKDFVRQINIPNDQEAVQMALQLQQEINKTKTDFTSELVKLRKQFESSLYELQTRMSEYFNNLNQLIYDSFRKRREHYIVEALTSYTRNGKVSELSEFLQQLKQYKSLSLQQELNFYRNHNYKKLGSFNHTITKLNFKTEFGHVVKLFKTLPHSFNLLQYQWNNAAKASTILINGKVATQKASNTNGERFALVEQKNGTIGDIKIQFKINKLKGWVGVGICLKKIIVNAGFKFNYTQTFHGSYLISANGYSWSHSKPEFNSAYKSFVFHEGDTIQINYSEENATVSFENKKNSSKFTLSTLVTDSNDHYVPCVNLCNPGDEVEIINDIQ